MKVIDAHMHLVQTIAGTGAGGELRHIGGGMAAYASGETFRMLPEAFSDGQVTPEDLLRLMDAEQVERAVLLQGNYFGFQNLYSLQAQKAYPDRFLAACSYDPFSRQRTRIRAHLFEELGARAVKFECSTGSGLMCNHEVFPLDGDMMEEEYAYADSLGLICIMDIGKLGSPSWQVDALRRVILRHPGLRFVVCHLLAPSRTAGDEMATGLRALALPNVWFDLAALPHNIRPEEYPYETAQMFVERAIGIVGADRILFGSDAPSTLKEDTYGHLIGFVRDTPRLDEETRRLILHDNAMSLFFGDKA